jgi:hypothetical protein
MMRCNSQCDWELASGLTLKLYTTQNQKNNNNNNNKKRSVFFNIPREFSYVFVTHLCCTCQMLNLVQNPRLFAFGELDKFVGQSNLLVGYLEQNSIHGNKGCVTP